MDAKFGNLQLQCSQQFDDETKPTLDFTIEDLLNFPHDDDTIINQDVEPNFDHFDDHHNQTAVIKSNSNSHSSTFVNHVDNSNSFNSLFPLPGGSHLLDELIHAPLPSLGREERRQLIPIEESAVKRSFSSRKYAELAQLQWISDFVGEETCSSENLNKLLDTTMSAMKARPDKCSETQYYPLEPARDESVSPSSISETEKSAPTRSKRPRTHSVKWRSRPVTLAHGDSEPIQVTPPTKPVGSKKKGSGMGKHRPTIDSTQGGEVRKCLHCATDKTPQWRSGPMGPKTLCNACGVRYKSGRLVPEYRPAASPTFVMAKHSNSHRKVLELQRQKNAMRLQQMQQMQQQQQQFQHDHFNHHIPNNNMMFHPSNNDDYLIPQHFGPDFRNLI